MLVVRYILERIFMQSTSNDVVPGKEVPFGGLNDGKQMIRAKYDSCTCV